MHHHRPEDQHADGDHEEQEPDDVQDPVVGCLSDAQGRQPHGSGQGAERDESAGPDLETRPFLPDPRSPFLHEIAHTEVVDLGSALLEAAAANSRSTLRTGPVSRTGRHDERGGSPKCRLGGGSIPPMSRQQKESMTWFDPSQIFTDTQRVDLFNDPKWETMDSLPRRSGAKWGTVRRVLVKRGRHSRSVA